MPDPVSNAEIEDVLSSIRRLVSEEPHSVKRRNVSVHAVTDRLVLRPEQRIAEFADRQEAAVDASRAALRGAWQPDAEDDPDLSGIADLADAHAQTEGAQAEDGQGALTLENRVAGLEAALMQSGGEWEPDGSEDGSSDLTRPISADAHFNMAEAWKRGVPPNGTAPDTDTDADKDPEAATAGPDRANATDPHPEEEPVQAAGSGPAEAEPDLPEADQAAPVDEPANASQEPPLHLGEDDDLSELLAAALAADRDVAASDPAIGADPMQPRRADPAPVGDGPVAAARPTGPDSPEDRSRLRPVSRPMAVDLSAIDALLAEARSVPAANAAPAVSDTPATAGPDTAPGPTGPDAATDVNAAPAEPRASDPKLAVEDAAIAAAEPPGGAEASEAEVAASTGQTPAGSEAPLDDFAEAATPGEPMDAEAATPGEPMDDALEIADTIDEAPADSTIADEPLAEATQAATVEETPANAALDDEMAAEDETVAYDEAVAHEEAAPSDKAATGDKAALVDEAAATDESPVSSGVSDAMTKAWATGPDAGSSTDYAAKDSPLSEHQTDPDDLPETAETEPSGTSDVRLVAITEDVAPDADGFRDGTVSAGPPVPEPDAVEGAVEEAFFALAGRLAQEAANSTGPSRPDTDSAPQMAADPPDTGGGNAPADATPPDAEADETGIADTLNADTEAEATVAAESDSPEAWLADALDDTTPSEAPPPDEATNDEPTPPADVTGAGTTAEEAHTLGIEARQVTREGALDAIDLPEDPMPAAEAEEDAEPAVAETQPGLATDDAPRHEADGAEEDGDKAALVQEPPQSVDAALPEDRDDDSAEGALSSSHAAQDTDAPEHASDVPAPESSADDIDSTDPDDDADTPFNLYDDESGLLDEEALRQMVAELVREELQGVLGERITRNVRRLVRREIERALAIRDLS